MAMSQGEQAGMAAATTTLAMMVPYGTIAAAAITIFAGSQQEDDSAAAAKAQRDHMVRSATMENTADNSKLKDNMDDAADAKFAAQLEALKAESMQQNTDTGVQGITRENAENEIQGRLSDTFDKINRSQERAERDVAMNKQSRNHSTQGRINSIQRTQYDATGDVLNAGLTIYGHNKRMAGFKGSGGSGASSGKAGSGGISFGAAGSAGAQTLGGV